MPRLDQKFFEILGLTNKSAQDDMFGIEVEVEGRGLRPSNTTQPAIWRYYKAEADGSLRTIREQSESVEYVFKNPLNYKDTNIALATLFSYLNSERAEVFESYRTSIHVHVNCLNETLATVYNYITLATIFDELFVGFNGEYRPGNNFCLRVKDAQAYVDSIINTIKSGYRITVMDNGMRYSSVNVVSLKKYGTLEFRSLECTTSLRRVRQWVDTIQQLKVAARGFENPAMIISAFSQQSVDGFINSILGEQLATFYKTDPKWREKLYNGMRIAQDIAYASDWPVQPPAMRDPRKIYEDILAIAAAPPGQWQAVHFDDDDDDHEDPDDDDHDEGPDLDDDDDDHEDPDDDF